MDTIPYRSLVLSLALLFLGFQPSFGQIGVELPQLTADVGEDVAIPIEVDSVDAEDVTSYQFTLPYDASVLSLADSVTTEGTITPGSANVQVVTEEGETRVSVATESPLSGSGTLLELHASLVGPGTTPLSFSEFQLFDVDGNEVNTAVTAGEVVAEAITVTLPQDTADVGATVELPITVDSLGADNVTSYQFTLPYDSSVLTISDSVVTEGTITPASADVQVSTQDGEISVSVAADDAFSGSGSLLTLRATLTDAGTAPLSFSNFQLFDADGAEVASETVDGQVVSEGLLVTLPELTREAGDAVTIPVDVEDLSDRDVTSYQFTLPYDASILSIDSVSTEGTITPSSADVQVSAEDGEVSVSVAADAALSGSGALVNLEARLVGAGTADLNFSNFQLFDSDANEVVTSLQGGQVVSEALAVTLPQQSGRVGDSLSLPVEVDSLDGKDVTSYQFTLPFDASVVDIVGVDPEGTLTPSSADIQVSAQSGEISVSVAADAALSGSGTLITLEAELVGTGSAPLSFSNFQLFNSEGDEVITETNDGEVTARGVLVSLPDASGDVDQMVPVPISVDTLNGTDVTSYQFTLPYDASVVSFADSVTTDGTLTPSTADVQVVTENGEVRVSVATDAPITGSGELLQLNATAVNEGEVPLDFSTFELFDSDGNEVATTLQAGSFTTTGVEIRLPDTEIAISAETSALPIDAEDLSGLGITAYQFTLPYDSSILSIDSVSTDETLTPSSADVQVVNDQGEIRVSVATDAPLSGSGTLLNLVAAPNAMGTAPLAFSDLQLFDQDGNEVTSTPVDGQVVVGVGNEPPEITSLPSGSVPPNSTFEGQVEASDPDDDPLSYALAGNPANASIDTSGAFTFTPTFDQRGSEVSFTVEVSDGTVTVDSSFAIAVEPLNRQPISVNINQSFGDPTDQSNYLLVGLPGQVDLPIEETLEGQSGETNDWRAFWDDGSASNQDGLVEFDGSSQFNFQAGRGFWVLARNPWTVSGTFDPVPLDDNGRASIPLHEGWNIISNPFGKSISWSSVQDANGVSAPLWSFDQGYSQSSTFASAQNGEAYYFLNPSDQPLDQLQIPYFEGSGASQTEKSEEVQLQVLQLKTIHDGETTSSVHVGLRSGAENGKDEFDHFAPPSFFETATVRAQNQNIDSKWALAADVRPVDSEGQRFTLSLDGSSNSEITLRAANLEQFGPNQHIRLFDSAQSKSYNLKTDRTITVTPQSETREFVLLIGSESFVQSEKSDLVPEQVKLHQNYPNPFREQTTLRYALPEAMKVRLEVYDLLGRRVKTLVDGQKTAGVHTLQWDGQSRSSQHMASGTYLVRLQAGDQTRTMKMVLVK